MMARFALFALLTCWTAAAQQPPGLTQFLSLTPAQITSIQQLNSALDEFTSAKSQRLPTLQAELAAESAKASPDPQVLGQRNIEIDAIQHEITAEAATVQEKVTALLTPGQRALVQQISTAIVQRSRLSDAGCAFLANPPIVGALAIRSGDFLVVSNSLASILLGAVTVSSFGNRLGCPAEFPISIRNYLELTDAEVSQILSLQAAYISLELQKNNRTADVQAELRDETARTTLDPLALGVRQVELASITRELQEADSNGRKAARALLTDAQQTKLKSLMDLVLPAQYQFSAQSCNLLPTPPGIGTGFTFYTPSFSAVRFSCQLN